MKYLVIVISPYTVSPTYDILDRIPTQDDIIRIESSDKRFSEITLYELSDVDSIMVVAASGIKNPEEFRRVLKLQKFVLRMLESLSKGKIYRGRRLPL